MESRATFPFTVIFLHHWPIQHILQQDKAPILVRLNSLHLLQPYAQQIPTVMTPSHSVLSALRVFVHLSCKLD